MKNTLFVLSLLFSVGLFTGCSSSPEEIDPVQEGFIRFKSDGVEREFIPGPFDRMGFSYDGKGSIFNAGVQVLRPGSTGTGNFIQFTIRNEVPFVTGVDYDMQEAVFYQGVPLPRIVFTYSDEQSVLYNAVLLEENFPLLVIKDAATFRFTSITEEWVEGTFSALLTGPVTNLSVGDQERRLTEGRFRMRLLDLTP
jgi:hypothetical protein